MKHEESVIQSSIVSALSLAGVYVFMVGNDNSGKTNMAKIMRLKSMGMRAGLSDLVVVSPDGRAHFMEVKTDTGKLSENQVRFKDLCDYYLWPYAVVRSPQEALDICRKWGIL